MRSQNLDWTSMVSFDERRYAPRTHQPSHRHAFASITLVLRGHLDETAEARSERASVLGVVVKPPGLEHETRFGEDSVMTFRVALAPEALVAFPRWRAAFGDWRWVHGGPAAAAMLALLEYQQTRGKGGDRVALLRAALDAIESRAVSSPPPNWLERLRAQIESSPGAARLGELADRAGVHPVYLARAFRRHFGCSVDTHIRRRRVLAAARLVAETEAPLADVAYACGYADQAHFCRDFRGLAGLTPLGFRRLARPS